MKLKGRSVDPWGNVVFDSTGLIDHLMMGRELADDMKATPTPGILNFNKLCKELDHPEDQVGIYEEPQISIEASDAEHQGQWFIPPHYQNLDLQEYLLMRCHSTEQITRVLEEWQMFEERDMITMLKCLVFLVDQFRENNVLWGVGRGSSVASYILYLVGIHKVDSLAYDLDIKEFLK